MKRTGALTKSLAIAGTVLVSIPILAPLLFSVIRLAQSGTFMLDWLMPAELFPLVLGGSVLLLVAAFRARARRKAVGFGLGTALGAIGAGMVLTSVSGLASGRTEPEGVVWALVLALIGLYSASVAEMAVAGGLLVHDVFKRTPPQVDSGT